MIVHGRRVNLRPVLPSDYERLHDMENDPTSLATWRYHGSMPALADYEAALWQQTTQIMVVESRASGEVIGYTQLHDLDLRAGHGWFSTYAAPEHRRTGIVMEGTIGFCTWVFHNFPVRWLYAHSLPQNIRGFESSIRRGEMEHFGTLRERLVIDGEFTDVHVLGMERAAWLAGFASRAFTTSLRKRLRDS